MTAQEIVPGEKSREQSVDFAFVLRWLWTHKLVLIITSLLGLGIAVAFALTAREVFRAEVVVLEASKGGLNASSMMGQLGGIAGLAGIDLGGSETGRHDRALLRSRRLAEEFIVRHKLVPLLMEKPLAKPADTLWFAVRRFRANYVSVREDTRTELITVSLRAESPEQAAQWANGYIDLANQLARAKAIDEGKRNIEYLRTEIGKTEVAELQRVLFQLVESESKTLMLASARPQYAFSTVDPAVPPAMRDSPRRAVMSLLGLIAGFVVGVLIIVGRSLLAGVRAPRS